jgi:hypothetical protein
MKVFSKNPYSNASTDDIAAMADILKGHSFITSIIKRIYIVICISTAVKNAHFNNNLSQTGRDR